MTLKEGASLQDGKYIIKKVLGQGGFGITYLGDQTSLGRKVAIKEFFMKELCNRDEATSHVSVGSEGSREMVTKFREKFLKEARNIASLEHSNIISVIDVFEENGTAYYVMKYCDGGSLAQLIKTKYSSGMPEAMALKYIREVASALDYIHKHNINHLDVKPENIMLTESDDVVLIDFGLSKQYDSETGQQTSSSPIGISEGYAPMEQYKKGGVGQFSPSTDIYALGATLYKLITGQKPPSAMDLGENPLPVFNASSNIKKAIYSAMGHRRADRPQSVSDFLSILERNTENTYVDPKSEPLPNPKPQQKPQPRPTPVPTSSKFKIVIYSIIAAAAIVLSIMQIMGNGGVEDTVPLEGAEEIVEAEVEDPETVATLAEASGYDVVFTCNVPSATLYIDGKASGSASNTHFLTLGSHTIKVVAEGYEDLSDKITVNSKTQSYKITLKENPTSVLRDTLAQVVKVTTGSHRGHEWVDLGLPSGTKWAACNIGASKKCESGSYFAWAETDTKESYTLQNLKYYLNREDGFSKYVNDNNHRIKADNKKRLEKIDDAAWVNWGKGWEMPTQEQFKELINYCKYSRYEMNGQIGFKFIGKNGEWIFLPAAGFKSEDSILHKSECYYWTRTQRWLVLNDSEDAICFLSYWYDKDKKLDVYGDQRKYGFNIRAVLSK